MILEIEEGCDGNRQAGGLFAANMLLFIHLSISDKSCPLQLLSQGYLLILLQGT
jgi:hypothetical protein